jgi:glycosyltransferase involved in cell wall biosynthesis
VLRFLDAPPLLEMVGRPAEREVVARYRWSDIAQQYVDTCQDMIHSKQQ